MQQKSNMVLLHYTPNLVVYYSSAKDCYLLSKLKCAMKYAIFFSKGTFQVWCGVETFIMPSVMCCEYIADRKATNDVGIICVGMFKLLY